MMQIDGTTEQDQMQMLMMQLQDANLRQSVMQYIKQTANGLDKNADNKLLIETLARESVCNQKDTAMWKSRTKKSLVLGVVAVVLAITVQFFVNYFTNELSKESHVDRQGAMVSTDGKVVKTQMEEMKVGTDGRLVSRDGGSSVKTMPTLARVVLASSLPDSTLMGLDEIVVYSDKGYTLQIKVQGFSRVPVLNSRCGNVVHFYTAWKGKLTLDSTDLSFDEATAAEFEKAGFSLAMGGRRLAGGSKVDGFFKALEVAKASGKWACADVPLPSIPKTRADETTMYVPCSNQRCESRFGSYLPGAEKVTGEFATRASGMYLKTQLTHMISGRYQVTMETMLLHPNQRLAKFFDAQKQLWQTFQLSADNTKSHCYSSTQKKTESKADADMHFEYIGTEEESGLVLRHFRMTRSHDFLVEMAGDAVKTVVTEFWDNAETLLPHRILDGDGTVVVFQSMKASVSDAEIEKRFGVLLEDCSKNEEETNGIPTMKKFQDLEPEAIDYYKDNFGQSEEVLQNAASNNDVFAIYLVKANDPLSVPEICKRKCQTEVDDAVVQMQLQQSLTCEEGGHLERAMNCMKNAHRDCINSNFYVNHQNECWQNSTVAERNLQETEEVEESMQLLHNDTLATAAQPRQMLNMGISCLSFLFIPMPFKWAEKITWPNGMTTYVMPMCMEMQLDKHYKPVTVWDNILDQLGFQISKEKLEQKARFTFRVVWSVIQDPDVKGSVSVGVEIMARACANAKWVFPALHEPNPLYAKLCAQADLSIKIGQACPAFAKVNLKGKVTLTFSVGLDFWVAWVELGKIQIGAETGMKKSPPSCAWVRAPEGPTRRRYWDRRRAPKRQCQKATCDVYIKGWITVTVLIWQVTLSLVYWMKNRRLEAYMEFSYYDIFGWTFEWTTWLELKIWEHRF